MRDLTKTLIGMASDTLVNWALYNPIVPLNVLCQETDTKSLKVGNGVDHWSALPYLYKVGTTPGTVCAGDDIRLGNARNPLNHAATHASESTDPITPAMIGAATQTQADTFAAEIATIQAQLADPIFEAQTGANSFYSFTGRAVVPTGISTEQTLLTLPLAQNALKAGDVLLIDNIWELTYNATYSKYAYIRLNGQVIQSLPCLKVYGTSSFTQCFVQANGVVKYWNLPATPYGTRVNSGTCMSSITIPNISNPILTVTAKLNDSANTEYMALEGLYAWRIRGYNNS